jgi:hypothetical protein
MDRHYKLSWKSHMEGVLRSEVLYHITLEKIKNPLMIKSMPNGLIGMEKHVD